MIQIKQYDLVHKAKDSEIGEQSSNATTVMNQLGGLSKSLDFGFPNNKKDWTRSARADRVPLHVHSS